MEEFLPNHDADVSVKLRKVYIFFLYLDIDINPGMLKKKYEKNVLRIN